MGGWSPHVSRTEQTLSDPRLKNIDKVVAAHYKGKRCLSSSSSSEVCERL